MDRMARPAIAPMATSATPTQNSTQLPTMIAAVPMVNAMVMMMTAVHAAGVEPCESSSAAISGDCPGSNEEPGFDDHELDEDSRDLIREFLRSGNKLLLAGDGRFEFRLPLSAPDNRWLKRELVHELLVQPAASELQRSVAVEERRSLGGSVTNTEDAGGELPAGTDELARELVQMPHMRFFWENDVSLLRAPGLTTIRLGLLGDESLHLHKAPGGLYHHALRDALRERGDRIEDGIPQQELVRRFEAFRGREAKLPPELAAKRG